MASEQAIAHQAQTTTRKLPTHFTPVVFAFFMSAIMSVLMSTVVTVVNRGVTDALPHQVLQAYCLAFPIAFCSVLLVRPLVMKLVKHTVQGHQ